MALTDRSVRRLQIKRLNIIFAVLLFILLLFIARVFQLTVIRGDELLIKSTQNFLRQWRIPPPRGIIYDRNGVPLAENVISYKCYFSPYRLSKATIVETISRLAEILRVDQKELQQKISGLKWRSESVLIAKNLALKDVTPILEQKHLFPGVYIQQTLRRHYPLGKVSAHIIGYVGRIPPRQLSEYIKKGYDKADYIGISGIEKVYESYLRGKEGYQVVVQNARGRVVDSEIEQPATPGLDLYLSIDEKLQRFCWEKIKNQKGVIIVENPQNGEILALVSSPSFDPEHPAQATGEDVSMLNRAIQGHYFPGSTVKPIFAIAALENGIKPEEKIYCSGKYYLPNWRRPFLCNQGNGHGYVDAARALQVSCNTYFYKSGQKLGGQILVDYAYRYGLGRKTGIDLPFEAQGFVPLYQYSELKRGLLVQFSIGQGKINCTPIQLVYAYSAIANNGKIPVPHLLLKVVNEKDQVIFKKEENWEYIAIKPEVREIIITGLYKVVNAEEGTAYRAKFDPAWRAAGKTGSAQNARGGTDALFVCFAPYDDPEILVLVLIENGGLGGHVAAPIARDILKFYYQHKE